MALGVIAAVGASRLTKRHRMYAAGVGVAAVDLVTQMLLVVLGLALLWSPSALTHGVSLGNSPSWHAIAFSIPLAMLAYTGLETVANLAEETRRPGVQLPKSLFAGIGAVVAVYVAIAVVGLMAFPARDGVDRARDALVGRAADGDRGCARARTFRPGCTRRCGSSSASPARSSCCSPPRHPFPASDGSRTHSANTDSCRERSDACTAARSSRRSPSSQRP